jgi:hypothetical protein
MPVPTESFIAESAQPMLMLIEEMMKRPHVRNDVVAAHEHIQKAIRLLERAHSNLR